MIRHIVMWKFRPGTEAEQRRFLDGLRGLQGVVPQLLRSEVAENVGQGDHDAVLVSEFQDLEALEAYKKDPRHQALSALCKSIREDRASVDYEYLREGAAVPSHPVTHFIRMKSPRSISRNGAGAFDAGWAGRPDILGGIHDRWYLDLCDLHDLISPFIESIMKLPC